MADSIISVMKRAMVLPAQPPPDTHLFLSCLDILWQEFPYNRRLIFYESALPDGRRQTADDVRTGAAALMEQLKSSLALCLVHYYPWCGHLAKGSEPPHRLFIDCSSPDAAGVEFVEASASLPLSFLAGDGFRMNPLFQQLCQVPPHEGNCLFSSPLLSIQATLFSDGGLALGIAHSHVVADGQSLWDFMVSWGECSRGVPLSSPPLHNREMLAVLHPSPEKAAWIWNPQIKEEDKEDDEQLRSEEGHSPMKKDEHTIDNRIVENKYSMENKQGNAEVMDDNNSNVPKDVAGNEEANASSVVVDGHEESNAGTDASLGVEKNEPLTQCMFHLPASAIRKLKIEAGGAHTSFEVMCAHFWKHVTFARENAAGTRTTFFFMPVNCRTRMRPPLPSYYFGNAIATDLILSTAVAIRRETLCATACRVHDAVARITDDFIKGFMQHLEYDKTSMADSFSAVAFSKGINTASSPWFPAYHVDYGWGKPVAVRPVSVRGDGELVLFGGHPGSIPGGVEICTALPESVLKGLLNDPAFLARPPSSHLGNH